MAKIIDIREAAGDEPSNPNSTAHEPAVVQGANSNLRKYLVTAICPGSPMPGTSVSVIATCPEDAARLAVMELESISERVSEIVSIQPLELINQADSVSPTDNAARQFSLMNRGPGMAKLVAVSGLLSEVLTIDRVEVERHAAGLRAVGRITGNDVGANECADLICCCLSTEPGNATGPYHLPYFAGVETSVEGSAKVARPEFTAPGKTFGEAIARLIDADEPVLGGALELLSVSGRGDRFRAWMTFSAPMNEPVYLCHAFGYEYWECLLKRTSCPPHLEITKTVGRQLISDLRKLLAGQTPTIRPETIQTIQREVRH